MARYRMNIVYEFDSNKSVQDSPAIHIINDSCPSDFGLNCPEDCSMYNCVTCWFNALDMGVKKGVKSVHVKRLD